MWSAASLALRVAAEFFTTVFEMVEEDQHEVHFELIHGQINYGSCEARRGKLQEQLERVSVAEDGVRAEVALPCQIVLEE